MGGSRAGSNGARDFQANAFQWNAKFARYAKALQYEKKMELFQQMPKE
jgi:hypothetical protein